MSEPFVFGVPLIARAAARDWALVDHLLGLTLRSVLAQSDPDFRLILAAHEVPPAWGMVADDPRFKIVRADWAVAQPTAANDDGGAKKWLIKQHVREGGGGLLMFLDADDWVAGDLVATARTTIAPGDVGAVIGGGIALDFASLRFMPFPLAGGFPFHGLCGSSTIGRIVAGHPDPLRHDPHAALGSHHEWEERAAERGARLCRLPTTGAYMVGTGENHSETAGPFATWRREVTAAVRQAGLPLADTLAWTFGQDLACLGAQPAEADSLLNSVPIGQ